MLCYGCDTNKLSKEFPGNSLSHDCDHPLLHCLKCTIAHVCNHAKCPWPECPVQLSNSDVTVQECVVAYERLVFMPRSVSSLHDGVGNTLRAAGGGNDKVEVVTLDGQRTTVEFHPGMFVKDVMKQIATSLKVETAKQRLVFNSQDLMASAPVAKYNIQAGDVIYLIIMLYKLSEDLDHVVFNMRWGYPPDTVRDYLDASCLVYENQKLLSYVDWQGNKRTTPDCPGLKHSGNLMYDEQREGNDIIHVNIKEIPDRITCLVFTLSAWEVPTMEPFPYTLLKFYEERDPNTDLCSTNFSHALKARAVIICSMKRDVTTGQWAVYKSGALTGGSAQDPYYSMKDDTIRQLMSQGHI